MKTKTTFRSVLGMLRRDEEGVMMTEYVILLSMLVVATIWLNKSADTLLFGADPLARTGNPTLRDETIPNDDEAGEGITGRTRDLMNQIGQNPNTSKKAYLSQVYIHISRP